MHRAFACSNPRGQAPLQANICKHQQHTSHHRQCCRTIASALTDPQCQSHQQHHDQPHQHAQQQQPQQQQQQQHQQQQSIKEQQAERRRATVKLPQLLTNQIAAATSFSQLHDAVATHGSRLNHFHVAKLLTRTSQLAAALPAKQSSPDASQPHPAPPHSQQQTINAVHGHHSQQLQLLYDTLPGMMAQRAKHTSPATLVASVAAWGRLATFMTQQDSLEVKPVVPASVKPQLHVLSARAEELRSEFTISQLSTLLWGFSKAGLKPTSSWMYSMFGAALQAYDGAEQHLQQLNDHPTAAPSAALHKLLPKPSLPLLGQVWGQQQMPGQQLNKPGHIQPHHHSLATDLALIVYAAAVMGQAPTQQLLMQWQSAVLQQLPEANTLDLSQMLWGLAVLRQNPSGQPWLETVLLALSEKLERCDNCQVLANSLWAMQHLTQQQQQPQQPQQRSWTQNTVLYLLPTAVQQALLEALYTYPSLPANPRAVSSCLASLASLKLYPEPSRALAVLDKGTDTLGEYSPRQLTDVLWACAHLNLHPNSPWLKAFLQAAARAADAGRVSVQQLGTLVWSLAVAKAPAQVLLMSQQLQVQVLLQALAAQHQGQGLHVLGPAGRSGVAWALAHLGIAPDRAWLSQLLTAAFTDGLATDQVRCAGFLFCIASLDFDYLVEWLGDFLEGKHGTDQDNAGGLDLSLQKYGALVAVLGALAEMDSKQLRAAWLDQTVSLSRSSDISDGAVGTFYMQLPPALVSWVDSLTDVALPQD